MLAEARAAWLRAAEEFIGNPSSQHRLGQRADAALEEARENCARMLGCGAGEIVWTSGATEANNLALHHAAAQGGELWISAIEHPSVLEAARYHLPKKHRLIPVTRTGVVDLGWVASRIRQERPGMIAVMAANNETGVLQPWREALALCRENEVPFFCDATQWIGRLPAAGLGECDFVSASAHKFGGPKGAGFLKCPLRTTGLLRGGPQEHGRRAGTENVPGVLSMLAAWEAREKRLAQGEMGEKGRLRMEFARKLAEALPGSELPTGGEAHLWNTVCAMMPVTDCQNRWTVKLDKKGFAVSTGSACASGKEKTSHVFAAMGRCDADARRVLRFSSGWETSEDDWDALLQALRAVHQELDPRCD